eukprot:12112561-Alexandrium_andersonii.AAC.1
MDSRPVCARGRPFLLRFLNARPPVSQAGQAATRLTETVRYLNAAAKACEIACSRVRRVGWLSAGKS